MNKTTLLDRHVGQRTAPWVRLAAIPGVLVILSWPVWRLGIATGLDPGWNTGLALAHDEGLRFGHDIGYAYGPLGYVVVPAAFSVSSLVGAAVYAVLGGACLVFAAVIGCSRRFGARVGLAAAAIVTLAAPMEIFAPEVYSLALVLLACLVAQREILISPTTFAAIVGVAAGVQTLVKPSAGAIAVIALAIAVVTAGSRLRCLAFGAAGYVGSLLVCWLLVAGQRPADFFSWVHLTFSLSAGYTNAMLFEEPGRAFEYGVMAILIAWIAVYAYRNVPAHPDARSSWFRTFLLVVALWIVLKEAFVRHDLHSAIGFWGVGLLAIAILPRVEKRLVLGGLLAASILMTSVATIIPLSTTLDPTSSIRSFFTAATAAVRPSERRHINAAAEAQARAAYLVPADLIARIGASGVHVDPFEVSAVKAYGLRWDPVPIFQRFQAYTELADSRNARALASSEGPDVVLRERTLGLDGRNDLWDSPRYMLALACVFTEWKATARWQLLEREENRCSPARPLAALRAPRGATITVPKPQAESSIVVATVTREISVADRLRSLVFKPASPFTVWADGTPYRVAPAPSSGPMIVRLPPGLWAPEFGGGIAYSEMRASSGATYVFQEVQLTITPAG